jgi:hypothetical protein
MKVKNKIKFIQIITIVESYDPADIQARCRKARTDFSLSIIQIIFLWQLGPLRKAERPLYESHSGKARLLYLYLYDIGTYVIMSRSCLELALAYLMVSLPLRSLSTNLPRTLPRLLCLDLVSSWLQVRKLITQLNWNYHA